ncbi:MAG: hypothetical protein AAF401_01550 [Pseudomonadota bacterium]
MEAEDPASREMIERISRIDAISDDDPDLRSGRTYVDRIIDAYADMRSSTRSFIETFPSEGRLLFLALLSDVIFFVARSISLVVSPPEEVQATLPEFIGLGLIAAFLFRTSLFYIIAAAANILSKPFGGTGTWYESRCGVFWAAMVSAPIELVGALLTVGVVYARPHASFLDSPMLIETPYFIGPIAFGFFLAAGVAEAQGFRYTYRVMAALAVVGVAVVWLAAYIGLLATG